MSQQELDLSSGAPDAIFIQSGNDANATQREKENALCVLFTELSDCLRKGCEVNIDDPRNIIVRAPKK